MTNCILRTGVFLLVLIAGALTSLAAQEMDTLWGESTVKLRAENASRGQLFDEGNYAMFIHWDSIVNWQTLLTSTRNWLGSLIRLNMMQGRSPDWRRMPG